MNEITPSQKKVKLLILFNELFIGMITKQVQILLHYNVLLNMNKSKNIYGQLLHIFLTNASDLRCLTKN
jgi:hypothetical protein